MNGLITAVYALPDIYFIHQFICIARVSPEHCSYLAGLVLVVIFFLILELEKTKRIDVFSGLVTAIHCNFMVFFSLVGEFQMLVNKMIPAYPTLSLMLLSGIGIAFIQFVTTIIYQHTRSLSESRFNMVGLYADSLFKLPMFLTLGLNVVCALAGGFILLDSIAQTAPYVGLRFSYCLIILAALNYYTFYYHVCRFV